MQFRIAQICRIRAVVVGIDFDVLGLQVGIAVERIDALEHTGHASRDGNLFLRRGFILTHAARQQPGCQQDKDPTQYVRPFHLFLSS